MPFHQIIIESIELADGPQLRRAVYDRLREAQGCAAAGDYGCAMTILDEIGAAYELNNYAQYQFWNFRGFVYFVQGETSLTLSAYEEILSLGDIAEWHAPEPWYWLASGFMRNEQFSDALRAMDMVCSRRLCDELLELRTEVISRMEARTP